MKDTIQTISQFKENILFNCIITIFFIVVFIITLCIIKKKAQLKNSIQHKVWWVTLYLMTFACIRLFMFIPSVIDLSTNNICVVEVSDYSCRYHHQWGGSLNPSGTTIDFSTTDGKRMIGHLVEDFEIPTNGYGYVLYAKYSHYILDCELYEK